MGSKGLTGIPFGALRAEVTLSHTNGDTNLAIEITVPEFTGESELEVYLGYGCYNQRRDYKKAIMLGWSPKDS